MKALLRGLQVMAAVFGWQFVLALGVVFGVLIGAIWLVHGLMVAVIALCLALLAIRAHDLGLDELEREAAQESASLAAAEAICRARANAAQANAVTENHAKTVAQLAASAMAAVKFGDRTGSEL